MTTLYLSTTGGHLEQLVALSARIPDPGGRLWVTHANEQSTSLLTGRDVRFVPYVRVRNVPDVMRCVPTAHWLLRESAVTRVVSTGSGIALGFLPYLAARGVECHYIESAARVSGPSLTGRVLGRIPGIRRYTQYPHSVDRHWAYRGSVLDSFRDADPRPPDGPVLRVVVTVGTAAEFPFDRLVRRLVPLLGPDGELARLSGRSVEVLWQVGCTPVADLPIDAVGFLPAAELTVALARADLVVTHAGTGSVLGALAAGRHPLVAPRQARWGEAGDDHQAQLADELVRRGIATAREPDEITARDLLDTIDRRVVRDGRPPTFELCP